VTTLKKELFDHMTRKLLFIVIIFIFFTGILASNVYANHYPGHYLPSINFDKSSYYTSDTFQITITNSNANTNSKSNDSTPFKITSSKYPNGISYNAIESGSNTGIFLFSAKVSSVTTSSDTLVASYLSNTDTATVSVPKPTSTDTDGDGISDSNDNCPTLSNKSQTNNDKDSQGDACDTDDDNDGILDSKDQCDTQPEDKDDVEDSDGCPDLTITKTDTDGDGISDSKDQCDTQPEDKDGVEDSDGCPESSSKYVGEDKVFSFLTQPIQEKSTKTVTDLKNYQKPTKISLTNIDPKIYYLSTVEDPENYAKKRNLDFQEGKTRLVINVEDSKADFIDDIRNSGWIESESGKQLQLSIPIDQIESLVQNEKVTKIYFPTKPFLHSQLISEGVSAINADVVQEEGITGKGQKIAVLDLAFDVENDEISDNIAETKSFRKYFGETVDLIGNGFEYVHGTSVAEIIVDVSPDAKLYLCTMGSEVEFQNAVDYAISKNVDIITMSAGWLNYLSDGSSPMTKKLEEAVNKGITTVLSAGNYAQSHWEGKFSDDDSDDWHEFGGTDEDLTVNVDGDRDVPILLYLLWEGQEDLDLVLYNPNGNMVDESASMQPNSENKVEYIQYVPEESGKYSIGIISESDSQTNIEIFSPTDNLEYSTKAGSVSVPTDAKGVIVTGAIYYEDSNLEPFSSQGPTNNGKQVPNLVGPDGVSTSAYKNLGQEFYGTSAASPYVAGVAALVLEDNDNLSPSQLITLIQEHADKNSVGLQIVSNNIFGHGKVDADFIIEGKSPSVSSNGSDLHIPVWIKGNARWWSEGRISDGEFLSGIKHMIKEKIIIVPNLSESEKHSQSGVPEWIRNNALWWADGLITDSDFAKGIEFLVKEGVISLD